MAIVNEDTVTIYDEIIIHNDEPEQEIDYNLEYDIKEDNNEVTNHAKKHSSLLDLDFTPQKNNYKSHSETDRKSSLQSTESVELLIYQRRTSFVTSNGGSGSVMRVDENELSAPMHQSVETGIDLWENTSSKKINYQLTDVNTSISKSDPIYHDQFESNDDIIYAIEEDNIAKNIAHNNNNMKNMIEIKENEQISIIKLDENKARQSLSVHVDAQYSHNNDTNHNINTRIISRKSSISTVSATTSVVYHDSESENISEENTAVLKRPVRSTSVIYYGSDNENINKLIIDSQINESRNSKEYKMKTNNNNINVNNNTTEHVNKSSILEMIGTSSTNENLNYIKPKSMQLDENDLDVKFYKEIHKERISHKSNNERLQTKNNNTNKKHTMKSKSEMNMNNKYIQPQILTTQNLIQLDYENKLDDYENKLNEIKNDLEDMQIINSKNRNNNRIINLNNDNIQRQTRVPKSKIKKKKIKASRIKYMTAIGAVCAVTVLIGFVMYTRNNNNNIVKNKNAANMLITPRRRRGGAPRIT